MQGKMYCLKSCLKVATMAKNCVRPNKKKFYDLQTEICADIKKIIQFRFYEIYITILFGSFIS